MHIAKPVAVVVLAAAMLVLAGCAKEPVTTPWATLAALNAELPRLPPECTVRPVAEPKLADADATDADGARHVEALKRALRTETARRRVCRVGIEGVYGVPPST